MDAQETIELNDFLPYRLSLLSNQVSNAISNYYADKFNLSISGWRVIALLAQCPKSTAADLVARTKMDKVAISRAVNALIQQGYVSRIQSKIDRRRAYLELTKTGHQVYTDIIPVAKNYEQFLISELTQEQLSTLDELLGQLTERALQLDQVNE